MPDQSRGKSAHDSIPFGTLKYIINEWKTVRSAPFTLLLLVVIAGTGIYWFLDKSYSGEIRAKNATIETLKTQLDSKMGVNRDMQIVVYTNDPNIERVLPQMTNSGAMAYKTDGAGPLWIWDIHAQQWK